ncbi:hypothetical protein G5B39_09710 [Rhodobacteraceae bacterium SC52]|nr:hypothetical protein G5B39_09710 [Rhodobacteraceae bacterium SC52]
MSILSRLFGKGSPEPKEPETETHEGFEIYAEPINEGGNWRLAGRIVKAVDGIEHTHTLIRADLLDSEAAAISATFAKARQVIEEQGLSLFR